MKKLKSLGNSRRNTKLIDYKKKLSPKIKRPKSLFKIIKKKSGRNNQGKITMRHQGGGHKRFYRFIDFSRYERDGKEGIIKSIEYDPNRNCFISLVSYRYAKPTFILSPEGIKVKDKIISGNDEKVPIKIGNNLPLKYIPLNTYIHNIELKPKKGGQLIRSAGTYAEIIGKEEKSKYVSIKLMSKEVRKILGICRATIGKLSNGEANLVRLGKAGAKRWRGVRPTVRGSAMNPVDHRHGGGEGKAPIGLKSPVSPWGKKTLGKKTRKKRKFSNKFIIKDRRKKK